MSIKFSREHEWIDASNPQAAVVGITAHAQDALGDVVFVDLPEVGKTYKQQSNHNQCTNSPALFHCLSPSRLRPLPLLS